MAERYRARVYLFGSRARGTSHEQSDYDLVAVSRAFGRAPRFRRCLDRDDIWLSAGGWRKALDLHCYTPEEFRKEIAGGLGYLASARSRGELLLISRAHRERRGAQGGNMAGRDASTKLATDAASV